MKVISLLFPSSGGVGLCAQYWGPWDILYRFLRVSINFAFFFFSRNKVVFPALLILKYRCKWTFLKMSLLRDIGIQNMAHYLLARVLHHLCKLQKKPLKCWALKAHIHTPTQVVTSSGRTLTSASEDSFNGRPVSFHGNRDRQIPYSVLGSFFFLLSMCE